MRLMSRNWPMLVLSLKACDAIGRAAGKRHACLLREVKSKACRRRDGDQMSDAELRRLLHQLETAAAGHRDEARAHIKPAARHRAQQFVERVVATDILAHQL